MPPLPADPAANEAKEQARLTPCQHAAMEVLESERNVFVTGGAGTGKSFLIRWFLRGKNLKTFPVLASTGAAAVLVGGRTFHSFFGLGIMEGGPDATVEKASSNRQVARRLRKISGFVVDEISMIPGIALATAEVICRRVRASDEPWGGLRAIVVGDFAQLPPVESGFGAERKRSWAFLDPVWAWSDFRVAFLRSQTRVRDPKHMAMLNEVREGRVDAEVAAYLDAHVTSGEVDFDGTRLFPRRDDADRFNRARLAELPGEAIEFASIFNGDDRGVALLRKSAPIPEVLCVKIGALVMLRQNDPQGRWVNGSTGHVVSTKVDRIGVELLNGRRVDLERATFAMLDAEGEIVASAVNFPLSLAWATTIHKSQGATLDRMRIDISRLWEPGQAYVALSRVPHGDGLSIEKWSPRSIKTDPDVTAFYARIEGNSAPLKIEAKNQSGILASFD